MDVPTLLLPGNWEIILIVVVVLLLFGASAIPKLARSIGKAQGEFQKGRKEFQSEVEKGRREAEAEEDKPDAPSDPAKPQ